MSEISQYDLLTNNLLFERKSPSKSGKHKIVTKLEVIWKIENDFKNLVE